jgi:hypothetical protein
MRTGRLFWGSLFVIVGLFLFLERLGMFSLDWDFGWKLWPLALILLGISFLVRNQPVRWILAILGALVLAFLLLSILSFSWPFCGRFADRAPMSQEFAEPYDPAIQRATLSLDAGAGTFLLGDTTGQLLTATTRSTFAEYDLAVVRDSGGAEARLTMKEHKVRFPGPRGGNRAEIRLNEAPRWDLEVDVGAAKVEADLTPFIVERLHVDAGASSLRLKLGGRAVRSEVDVDAGASSIKISVPESLGCEVRIDAPVSSKHLSGFQAAGSGVYRTDNFDSSDHKIFMRVDAGVSSIGVTRY